MTARELQRVAEWVSSGARVLARGGQHVQLEGTGRPRNVVIEFPSYDDAVACYKSPEYKIARAHREPAGTADIVIVEGV